MKKISTRQRILDFLNANPGSTANQIADHLAWLGIQGTVKLLESMRDKGEVGRVQDAARPGRPYLYTALVRETSVRRGGKMAAKKIENETPWLTVHRCDDSKRATPNQGGQGALLAPYRSTTLDWAA